MGDVAFGCTVGTGWAVVVAVGTDTGTGTGGGDDGTDAGLNVIDRRRVDLVAGGRRFAYHAAADIPGEEDAEALVADVRAAAEGAAIATAAELVAAVRAAGHRPVGALVVGPPPRPPSPVATVVRSHAAIHAAEGELYRSAVRQALAGCGLPVGDTPAKGLADDLALAAGCRPPDVAAAIAATGRALGPPWRREQKDAAMAAWLALTSFAG